jgi:hypothetical protein
MSFDTSDSPDFFMPDVYADEFVVAAGPDAYSVSDLVPTEIAAELVDMPEGNTAEPLPDIVESYNPWKDKQIHYIGNTALEGVEHPDLEARQRVDKVLQAAVRARKRDANFLANVPNRNEEFADVLAIANAQLRKDFGDAVAKVPMTILHREHYVALRDSETDGMVRNGRALIGISEETERIFGREAFLGVALHEGAHASGVTEEVVMTARLQKSVREIMREVTRGLVSGESVEKSEKYEVKHVGSGLFVKRLARPHGDDTFGGVFFEEAFAEGYRNRSMKELGNNYAPQGTRRFSSENSAYAFTDGAKRYPHIHPETGRLYMPWQYAQAVTPIITYDDDRVLRQSNSLIFGASGMASYAVDLLDRHAIPGLYADMVEHRQNPDIGRRISERIDSVDPGLYERLLHLHDNQADSRAGLLYVLRALNLENAPVENF